MEEAAVDVVVAAAVVAAVVGADAVGADAEADAPSAEVVASVEAGAGDDASKSFRPGSGHRSTSATCSADGPTVSATTTTASREIPTAPTALQRLVRAVVGKDRWKGTLPATGGAPGSAASASSGLETRVRTI